MSRSFGARILGITALALAAQLISGEARATIRDGLLRPDEPAIPGAYDLEISRAEARETLDEILRIVRLRAFRGEAPTPETLQRIANLVRSYRMDESDAPMAISEAPFLGLVLREQIPTVWEAAFRSARRGDAYRDNVENVPLDTLFDALLNLYLAGDLPPQYQRQADQIGHCWARKALQGRGPRCHIDLTDRPESAGTGSQAWIKFTCGSPLGLGPSACHARQVLYRSLKATLIEARRSDFVRSMAEREFDTRFPEEFRARFPGELPAQIRRFPGIVAQKFRGRSDEGLWSLRAPLVDALDRQQPEANRSKVTMHDFTTGLRADIGVAEILSRADSPALRGIAAALFYASANRLLLMTGERRAVVGRDARVYLRTKAGRPARFVIGRIPDTFIAGRSVGFTVEVVDAEGIRVTDYEGEIRFESSDRGAALPGAYEFSRSDRGYKRFEAITLRTAGEQSVSAVEVRRGGGGLRSTRGSIRVLAPLPGREHVFGVEVPLAPVPEIARFGGWSYGPSALPNASPEYLPWDYANYDPSRSLRLFSSEFMLDGSGVASTYTRQTDRGPVVVEPVQSIEDLAGLLTASVEFLRATLPGGALAPHFGTAEQMSELLNPESPILFPREGRMVAVGVLGTVLKNLTDPQKGHLSEGEFGLLFHGEVGLGGRRSTAATTAGAARLLSSAAMLRQLFEVDPDLPEDLKRQAELLDTALQMGALAVGSRGQENDGGFRDRMGAEQASGKRLGVTVEALRTISLAYKKTRPIVLLRRLYDGWNFIDRLWGRRSVPLEVQGSAETPTAPSVLWNLLSLWEETRSILSSDLSRDLDLPAWEARFERLKAVLEEQLDTASGPAALRT